MKSAFTFPRYLFSCVLIVFFTLFSSGIAFAQIVAQTRPFNGRVVDNNNNPLPGASITVKNSSRGTISNQDGKFNLMVQDNEVITLKLIGYKSQNLVITPKRINETFILESEANNLNQVVVVGYSSKNQSQLSSATTTITGSKLEGSSTSGDFNDLLQAKIAGVNVSNQSGAPGQSADIIIRGSGTLAGSHQPLYVVDGILNDENTGLPVNPNDIASVTVLKDGAATGIYGSRAANGVIVVTTKKGRVGRPQITYTGKLGFTKFLKGNIKLGSSKDVYNYQREAFTNRWRDDSTYEVNNFYQSNPNGTLSALQDSLNANFYPNESGATNLNDFLNIQVPPSRLNYNTDWFKLLFKTGSINSQSISLSAGSEKTTFFTSANYYKEVGTIIPTQNEDVDFRLNVSHIFSPKLKLDIHVNGGFGKLINEPSQPFYNGVLNGIYTYSPWDFPYNPDGSLRRGDEPNWLNDFQKNVLYPIAYNHDYTNTNNTNADFAIEYKPTPWLKLSSSNRGSRSGSLEEVRVESNTLDAGSTGGYLTQTNISAYQLITSNLATLNGNFGKHSLSGILGVEFQSAHNAYSTAGTANLPDGTNIINNGVNSYSSAGDFAQTYFNSYFSQIDYSYDSKYFGVASFRRDGSSVFGPNNKYGNFYSLGGSWLLNKESFLENSKAIDLLKLRLSYASVGNASIGTIPFGYNGNNPINNPSPYFAGYSYGSTSFPGYSSAFPPANIGYNNQPSAYPYTFGNNNLTWEFNRTINVGIDLGIFKRLVLNVDAYNRINSKLLQSVQYQATTGIPGNIYNIGKIRNLGLELNLNSINIQKKEFTWETNFNITFNRNKVLNLYQHADVYQSPNVNYKGDLVTSEGHEQYSFLLIKYRGVDPQTGNALFEKWTDKDGNFISSAAQNGANVVPAQVSTTTDPNQATLEYFGGFFPKFNAGLFNEFKYKGIGLSFLLYGVYGNNVYNWASRYFWGGYDGTINTRGILLDGLSRWHKPGDIAQAPKIEDAGGIVGYNSYSGSNNSRYLENGSFLRLKNVSLSYDLPSGFLSKLKISKLQIFAKGDNLITISKFLGFDPESDYLTADVDQRYPTAKKIVFGINLIF